MIERCGNCGDKRVVLWTVGGVPVCAVCSHDGVDACGRCGRPEFVSSLEMASTNTLCCRNCLGDEEREAAFGSPYEDDDYVGGFDDGDE